MVFSILQELTNQVGRTVYGIHSIPSLPTESCLLTRTGPVFGNNKGTCTYIRERNLTFSTENIPTIFQQPIM